MIDSCTLSHEAVATTKTDCKELRTTAGGSPHVTRRKTRKDHLDKTDGTTDQRIMVQVRVVREHPLGPSWLSSWRPGEDIPHDTMKPQQNLIGDTF